MSLFTPVFRPALYNPYSFSDLAFTKLSSLFRLEQQQKTVLKIHFEFAYFSFFLSHLVLKQEIRSYTPVVPLDTIPDSIPKWSKSISVFRPKRRKNHTLWGGTYLYGLYRGLRPPPPPTNYLCISGRFVLQGTEGQISIIGFTVVYNIFSKRKIKFWILYLQCIYLL